MQDECIRYIHLAHLYTRYIVSRTYISHYVHSTILYTVYISLEGDVESPLEVLGWNVDDLVERVLKDTAPTYSYLDLTCGDACSTAEVSELTKLKTCTPCY